MGMKPRKLPTLKISKALQEDIDAHAGGLRELLGEGYYNVPRERWQDALGADRLEDDYPAFASDVDTLWILGWFRGAADALGCEAGDLVVL